MAAARLQQFRKCWRASWLNSQPLAPQLKQKIGRLTQRVVDENQHALERIGGIRLLEEIADSIELLDQIGEDTIGKNVVHGRISTVRHKEEAPPAGASSAQDVHSAATSGSSGEVSLSTTRQTRSTPTSRTMCSIALSESTAKCLARSRCSRRLRAAVTSAGWTPKVSAASFSVGVTSTFPRSHCAASSARQLRE